MVKLAQTVLIASALALLAACAQTLTPPTPMASMSSTTPAVFGSPKQP